MRTILYMAVLATIMLTATSNSDAQCTFTSAYGSTTASQTNGATSTISTCNWAGEYGTINGITAGGTYRVNVGQSSNWVTIRYGSPSGQLISFSVQGTSWTAPYSGTYYAHFSNNSSCGTSTTCRTTSITTINIPSGPTNPCSSISSLSCGASAGFTLSASTGSWNNLGGPYSTPGNEQVFSFTPTISGTYSITITNSGYYVDLFYKTSSCSSSGWTYVDDIYTSATNDLTLTFGVTYFFLIDDENTSASSGTITINCPAPAPDPCNNNITNISGCGNTYSYSLGNGNGVWDNYGGPYGVPGQEKIYRFTPPTTGQYPISVTHNGGGWVDLFIKTQGGGCNSTGWTYIDDINSSATNTVSLIGGVTYNFLLDDENTTASSGTISVDCPCVGPTNGIDASIIVNGTTSYSSSTTNACNDCSYRPSDDRVIEFTIPCAGSYTISTCGTSWDTYLYLSDNPCGSILSSNDDYCGLQSSISYNFTNPGTYYITVEGFSTSSGGAFTLNINRNCTLSLSLSANNVSCNGGNDGSIFSTVSGSCGNVYYLWSNNTSNSGLNNLIAGTYYLNISDDFGCSANANASITEPLPLDVVLTNSDILCYGGMSDVVVNATGGTPPYNGTGTYTVPAGTYTYSIMDANDCGASASISITEPDELIADAGSDATTYYGYGPMECADINGSSTGGTGNISFAWSDGSTGSSISVCPSTSETFILTATDQNGCTAIDEVNVCVADVICFAGNSTIQKVEMCHNGHTICINASAVPSHLSHGCTLGSCDEINDCGPGARNTIQLENEMQVTIFPNPANENLTIELDDHTAMETFSYTMLNSLGQIIQTGQLAAGRNNISVSTLARDVYFLKIQGNSNELFRFVKF